MEDRRWENSAVALEFSAMLIMMFTCWFKKSSDIRSSLVHDEGANIFLGFMSTIVPVLFSFSRF
jgi:hypothetical protein